MKKQIVITATFFIAVIIVGFSQSASKNKDAISEVIELYVSVTDFKDSTAILKAFHPDAKLMSVKNDSLLKSLSVWEWWERISKIEHPRQRVYNVRKIMVTGLSAFAIVEFATSTDYISFLKFGNEWKIVNKTLSVSL